MPGHIVLVALLTLFIFPPDETLRRYGASDRDWHLTQMHGEPFEGRATIAFPERNAITGQGPCNRYTSTNITPYPWFEAGPIVATRRACPDLSDESAFFKALEDATLAIVDGDVLTFADDTTDLLIFKARD
ncbi:MAG: META domain-containing protein [Sulfitobacter sp.]